MLDRYRLLITETLRLTTVVPLENDTCHTKIGDGGCSALSDQLFKDVGDHGDGVRVANVRECDLSWNQIRKGGAQSIGGTLEKNDVLEKLNLAYNALGSEGGAFIAEGTRDNQKLNWLDLTSNSIGGKASMVFANALEQNEELLDLILNENPIGSAGARAMLRLYAGGEEDTALRLDNCNIDIDVPDIFDPNRPAGEYVRWRHVSCDDVTHDDIHMYFAPVLCTAITQGVLRYMIMLYI